MSFDPPRFSRRTIEAYRVPYPDASIKSIRRALRKATGIDEAEVEHIRQENNRRGDCIYLLHPERTGIFVVAPDGGIVTFLFFRSRPEQWRAQKLYPSEVPAHSKFLWARSTKAEPGLFLTLHVMGSYQMAYPGATPREVLGTTARSEEIEPSIALRLVGREPENRTSDSLYRLHPERTGIFVLAPTEEKGLYTIVTFLRFYALQQHELACRLYPKDIEETTASLRWAPS